MSSDREDHMSEVLEPKDSFVYLGAGRSQDIGLWVLTQSQQGGGVVRVKWPSCPLKRGHLCFGFCCLLLGRNTALYNYMYKIFNRSLESRYL